MTPIGQDQILIAGGWGDDGRLGDGYMFDTKSESVSQCMDGTAFKFTSRGNQCAVINQNQIAALVTD